VGWLIVNVLIPVLLPPALLLLEDKRSAHGKRSNQRGYRTAGRKTGGGVAVRHRDSVDERFLGASVAPGFCAHRRAAGCRFGMGGFSLLDRR